MFLPPVPLQLFDYGDWGISVVEDEGTFSDHTAGIGANDGRWHHIAVTWRSFDGQTKLYDNGREVWSVTRGKGQRIPSGGTLVIGREQGKRFPLNISLENILLFSNSSSTCIKDEHCVTFPRM